VNVSFAQIRLAYFVLAGVDMPKNLPFHAAGSCIVEATSSGYAKALFAKAQKIIDQHPVGRPGSEYAEMAAAFVAEFGPRGSEGRREKLLSLSRGMAAEEQA
jgi:hypothetical protein